MTHSEIIEKVTPMLKGLFTAHSISGVNHNPHPYVIGPKHIQNNVLTPEEIERLEVTGVHCAYPGCRVSFRDHTYDNVLFLSLTKDITNDEANEILKPVAEILEKEKIAGIAFVETEEKFRIK
jgi:hypothetical protein